MSCHGHSYENNHMMITYWWGSHNDQLMMQVCSSGHDKFRLALFGDQLYETSTFWPLFSLDPILKQPMSINKWVKLIVTESLLSFGW